MKKALYLLSALALFSCERIVQTVDEHSCGGTEFYAVFEGADDTRTYIDDQIRMRWHADDRIAIFNGTTYRREFAFTGETGDNAGGFTQVSTDDTFWSGYDVSQNFAVYPYSTRAKLDETDLFLTVSFPADQVYSENTFDPEANVMVAVTESTSDGKLMFKNAGAFLRVKLYGEEQIVSSIELKSKGSEAIAGQAYVTPTYGGDPSCVMVATSSSASSSINLKCEDGVKVGACKEDATSFWIVLPPVTFEQGLEVIVNGLYGGAQTYSVDKSVTFGRNKFMTLEREITNLETAPYIETDPYNFSLTADASEITFTLYGEASKSFIDADWISIVSNEETEDGVVYTCSVQPNMTGSTRTGAIVLSDDYGYSSTVISVVQGTLASDFDSYAIVGTWSLVKEEWRDVNEGVADEYEIPQTKTYTFNEDGTGSYSYIEYDENGEVVYEEHLDLEYVIDAGLLQISLISEGEYVEEYWPIIIDSVTYDGEVCTAFTTFEYYANEYRKSYEGFELYQGASTRYYYESTLR